MFSFLIISDSNYAYVILNAIHREKMCFTQSSTRMAASDFFHVFIQSVKFYTFYHYVLNSTDV